MNWINWIKNKTQPITIYKNNSRDSSKFEDYSPLQLHHKLKGLNSAHK